MAANANSPVPKDYDELFRLYWDYIVGLVTKLGIRDDAENTAAAILAKFLEKDFLSRYNPDATFETDSGHKRTSFQGFLSGFVSIYVRQFRDKQYTKARKEPVSTSQPVGESGTPWLEVYGPTADGIDQLTTVSLDDAIERAQAHLDALPIRGKRNLALVFKTVIRQQRTDGRVNRKEIQELLGVSPTAVSLTFEDLRAELARIGFYGALAAA
jgi:hypothetical protein